MSAWAALDEELARWADLGQDATLWWRDDDAALPDARLDRLLALSDAHQAPLLLAVIPARAEAALAARLGRGITVAQHGYAHLNHAPPGERKIELGTHRPTDLVIAELAVGWDRLSTLFAGAALPILVPPWNRIAPHLVPMLPELRYQGLSTRGPRARRRAVGALVQANIHVDIIDWQGHRGFVGTEAALAALVGHLAARRTGKVADPSEPSGIVSHHLAHDEGCWAFLEALLARTADRAGARWLSAGTVFEPDSAVPPSR